MPAGQLGGVDASTRASKTCLRSVLIAEGECEVGGLMFSPNAVTEPLVRR
jgi:hypothetical protein